MKTASAKGILHRDVSPNNIIYFEDEHGQVRGTAGEAEQ